MALKKLHCLILYYFIFVYYKSDVKRDKNTFISHASFEMQANRSGINSVGYGNGVGVVVVGEEGTVSSEAESVEAVEVGRGSSMVTEGLLLSFEKWFGIMMALSTSKLN